MSAYVQLQAEQEERQRLTDPRFLRIMLIGGIILPIIGIIIGTMAEDTLIIAVLSLVILPSGILFTGNGIRLLYGVRIQSFLKSLWDRIIKQKLLIKLKNSIFK